MPEYHVIPNEEEVKRLKKEYGLTKDQITKDVATVRSWMLTQPHLPKLPESKNGNYIYFYITMAIKRVYFFSYIFNN